MESFPVPNTSFEAASHAHPLPGRPSPRAIEEQRVRAMIARQSVAVKLQGLSCERAPTVTDVLTPKIRRSPFNENVNPIHLDLTECWKGLSHSQAAELTMWYHFFHECLHDVVRASLCQGLVKDLLRSKEFIDEVYLLPRMVESLHSEPRRVLDIDFVHLIDSMMGMFHKQYPNVAASVASIWSHFSGGLSRFLHNFLRMQDCFCDSPSGPCIEVYFDFQYADSVLTATGNVAWQIPSVRFLPVPGSLSTGEQYRITPFILNNVLHVRSQDPNHYADEVTYTVPRSSLSFSWNPMKQCFKAVVPDFEDDKLHVAETVLNASIVTLFSDDVKFERQSRWSIKLSILPADSSPDFRSVSTDMNIKHTGRRRYAYSSAFRDALRTDIRSDHGNSLQNTFGHKLGPPSPQKRKVSRPEGIDETCGLKRRRCSSVDEDWNTISVDTGKNRCNVQRSGVDQRQKFSLHAPPTTWRRRHAEDDSGFSSPDTPPGDSDSSVPNTAVDMDSQSQQQQIMRNYQEFADRKLLKDIGLLISPVSDGERRAFESIFLEDGEESSPITDENVVDMGDVMEEV